jgi:hypothetical protein
MRKNMPTLLKCSFASLAGTSTTLELPLCGEVDASSRACSWVILLPPITKIPSWNLSCLTISLTRPSTRLSPAGGVSSLRLSSGASQLLPSAQLWPSSMATGARLFPQICCKLRYYATYTYFLCILIHYVFKRDYFGAHTFRVLPGKENAKFKAGEDIREYSFPHLKYYSDRILSRRQLDRTRRKRFCLHLQHISVQMNYILQNSVEEVC